MKILVWVWVILMPFLLGRGGLRILYWNRDSAGPGRGGVPERDWGGVLCTGLCLEIGFMEAAHLAAVFLDWSLAQAALGWDAVCFLWGFLSLVMEIAARRREKKAWKEKKRDRQKKNIPQPSIGEQKEEWESDTGIPQLLAVLFGISVLLQLMLILTGDIAWWDGDMTLETVQSFLRTDGIYLENPLTGAPYEAGLPLRIQILCLPTLYAALCGNFAVSPLVVVGQIVPAAVLLGSYCAYGELGKQVFPQSPGQRRLFLLIVSLLLWAGDYMISMDGFQLLHCGYRGTAIRAGILFPFTLCMCLRRRWKIVILCILAEACIVWTFYGMGVCLLTAVLFGLVNLAGRWKRKQKERT